MILVPVKFCSLNAKKIAQRRRIYGGIVFLYTLFRDVKGFSVRVIDLSHGRYMKGCLPHFTEDGDCAMAFFLLLIRNCVSAAHLSDVYEDEF